MSVKYFILNYKIINNIELVDSLFKLWDKNLENIIRNSFILVQKSGSSYQDFMEIIIIIAKDIIFRLFFLRKKQNTQSK